MIIRTKDIECFLKLTETVVNAILKMNHCTAVTIGGLQLYD